MTRPTETALALLVSISSLGCSVGYFHSQTTWNDDGSVERAVLQPAGKMVDGADSPENWGNIARTPEHDFDFRGDIRDAPEEESGAYTTAWKRVAAGQPLPEHYHNLGDDEDYESRFERTAVWTDYGLVVEYAWEETLTEVVRLADLHKALQEVTVIGGKAASQILGQALGDKYDVSLLETWVTTEGREWLLELADVLYDAALRDESFVSVRESVQEICQKRGLKLTITGEWTNADEKEGNRFIRDILRRTIRTAEDNEADNEILEGLIDLLNDRDDPEHAELKQRIAQAVDDYHQTWPGGKEAFDAKWSNLQTRVLGVHGAIFGQPERFRFRMSVPGQIVETNGRLLGEGAVEWQFGSSDAWPAGVVMRVRSVHDQTASLKTSIARNFKSTPASLQRLIRTIGDEEPLRKVLQACREQSSDAPLAQLRKQLPDDHPMRERITAVLEVLEANGR